MKKFAMNTLLSTTMFILMSIGLVAQTSVTYKNNSLLIGNSYSFREIKFTDPGNAGANQIWDFSKIQYTGESPLSSLEEAPSQKITGVSNCNLLLNENGYDFLMNSSENALEEYGCIYKKQNMTLIYSDPLLKMKYPFTYGEQYTDHFIGAVISNEIHTIDFFGDYSAVADAYGSLILPDRIIENTLRVKSIKKGLQINMCGTTDVSMVRYLWYASGYRYPVLSISTVENHFSERAPEIIKTAFLNTGQPNERSASVIPNNTAKQTDKKIDKQDVVVIISPNPFTDKLTYRYFLTEPMDVSIELHDISGQIKGWLVTNQNQSEGLHTGELDAVKYTLTPGIYFIRFTFDKQVVISKIVKL
jgi:hypothetical protein